MWVREIHKQRKESGVYHKLASKYPTNKYHVYV